MSDRRIETDLYGLLEVSESASKAEISRAYRKLAQRHHPDANKGDPRAEARFKKISEAHSILPTTRGAPSTTGSGGVLRALVSQGRTSKPAFTTSRRREPMPFGVFS